MAAHLQHMDNLVCLENFNSAQVTAEASNRPNPEAVVRELCLQEADYLAENIYEIPADPGTPSVQILKPHMREVLGLWMCQVCNFREVDVFPTAISIADRFFSRFPLTCDDQIQLAGAVSLHLASKLRETVPMSTEDVLYYTDDAYIPANMKDMEIIILATLNFDLIPVTPAHFLDAFMHLLDVPVPVRDRVMADALRRINIALIGTDLLTVKPSAIALACLVGSLSSAGLSIDGALLDNLCHAIDCDQSKLVACMNKSVNAWSRHYSTVYEVAAAENVEERSDEEDESDGNGFGAEDDSDVDMDEGLVVDCGRERRECPQSDLNDYLMDSDSGIQEDFLSSQSSSGSTPRHRVLKVPSAYYDDSDDANCSD